MCIRAQALWKPVLYENRHFMKTDILWKPALYETGNILKPELYGNRYYMKTGTIWNPVLYEDRYYMKTGIIWNPVLCKTGITCKPALCENRHYMKTGIMWKPVLYWKGYGYLNWVHMAQDMRRWFVMNTVMKVSQLLYGVGFRDDFKLNVFLLPAVWARRCAVHLVSGVHAVSVHHQVPSWPLDWPWRGLTVAWI